MKNRIQALREERHMTQIRLSIELGVSQETVSAYEIGRHYPSVSTLLKMSRLLNASCDYILGLSDVRTPSNSLSQDEQSLLSLYRALSPGKKEKLHAYLSCLADS